MELRTLSMIHELKLLPEYFEEVASGYKTFEIRKNDREFMVGDKIILEKFLTEEGFTGDYVEAVITYITDYEQKEGFVVFSMEIKRVGFDSKIQMREKR